jgi:hypothetical protein
LGFINTREAHGGDDDMPTDPPTKTYPPELRTVLERASAGDEAALPLLQRALDAHPELVAVFGDLVRHAEQATLRLVAGACLTAREAIHRQMNELRARLAATAATELERLLVDRLCITWLQVYHADVSLAERVLADTGASPAGQAAQRRLDAAHRRFLSGVKALAVVQKLVRPAPSPVDLAMRPVPEGPAGRLAGVPAPADGEPVLN